MGLIKSVEVDCLMNLSSEVRGIFLTKVMEGVKPAFKVTQPGDPVKQQELRASLPNRYTAIKIEELRPLKDEVRELEEFLFDHEMSLGAGG